MQIRTLDRTRAVLATLTALTVAAMVAGILSTRGSRDALP